MKNAENPKPKRLTKQAKRNTLAKPVVAQMPSLASRKCSDHWDGCRQL